MPKLSDLESEVKQQIENELEAKSSELGMDAYDSYSGGNDLKLLKDFIGICADCKSLQYCKTEFGKVFAKCSHYEMKLSGQNRITECTCHDPKGVLSLQEMYAMAHLIDADPLSVKGFISNDPKFRKKKLKKLPLKIIKRDIKL
jgi:hypothetical protein